MEMDYSLLENEEKGKRKKKKKEEEDHAIWAFQFFFPMFIITLLPFIKWVEKSNLSFFYITRFHILPSLK